MDLILGIFIAVAGMVIFNILNNKTKGELGISTKPEEGPPEKESIDIDLTQAYQPKYLLTKNEWHEYKKLKELAAGKGLQVCPKVRLLDIIEPRKGHPKYKTLFYKIQAKHIDFLITDPELRIKAVVELDDGSHDTKERKDRDNFIDQILTSCGYKIIRTRSITEETIKNL